MKFSLGVFFVLSSVCLCAFDYTRMETDVKQNVVWLKGPTKDLGGVSTEPKNLLKEVKVTLKDGVVEVDAAPFFRQKSARRILLRFRPRFNPVLAGKNATASLNAACDREGSLTLFLEGSRGPQNKHYWSAMEFPVTEEKETFRLTKNLPEDLKNLWVRVDLTAPGVYRFYEAELGAAEEIRVDSSVNHIRNGGAERGWYGTGMHGFQYLKTADDNLISDGRGKSWDKILTVALDEKVRHSGRHSFRLSKPKDAAGRFNWNPVPFLPGKSASLSCWIKGERPNQRAGMSLFLGNGIAYEKRFTVSPEWKKYELFIPDWGKKAPGVTKINDTANGYAAVNGVAVPIISGDGTIWVDDVAYSIGGHSAFKPGTGITASAKLDSDRQYYLPGKAVTATLTLSSLSAKAEKAEIRWSIRDFFGKTVLSSNRAETLPVPAGGTLRKEFRFNPPPDLRGALNLVFDVNGETTGLYFGILDPPKPLSHRVGVNYDPGRGNDMEAIPLLKDFRIGALRLWSHFRSTPNAGFRSVDVFHKNGFYLMMCISGPLGHAPSYFVPSDFSAWSSEVASFARRYRGKVQIYEILNESNIWGGRAKNPDPSKYLEMNVETNIRTIEALAKALRSADPQVQIAGPASCHTDVLWTSGILAGGGAKYLDVITEHPYRQIPELPDYETDIQSLRKVTDRYRKEYPLTASEAGKCSSVQFQDNLIPDYARRQVAYNTRMMLIGLANGLQQYYHFSFGLDAEGTGWNFILQGNLENRHHPIPSPVMFACRNAIDRLEDAKPLERIRIGSNYRCYLFDRGDVRVATIWKWNGKPDTMKLSPELRRSSRVYDVMGTKLGTENIELGPWPFYLESSLSAAGLKQAVLNSGFSSQEKELFDVSPLITEKREFELRIRNLSPRAIRGTASVNGRSVPFRNIPPEESVNLAFPTERPISMNDYPVRAEIREETSGQKKTLDLNLKAVMVPRTVKALTIDGDLSDWPAEAEELPLSKLTRLKAWSDAENGIRGSVRFAWDDTFFYLAVTAFKKEYVESEVGVSGLWLADGIQFAFDPIRNATKAVKGYQDDDFEYAAALLRNKPVVYRSAASVATYDSLDKTKGVVDDVACAIRVLPGKTVYELAFPRQSVSPFRLKAGEAMRADVLLNIGNAKGRAGYLQLTPGIGEAPKLPGEFVDLVLQK